MKMKFEVPEIEVLLFDDIETNENEISGGQMKTSSTDEITEIYNEKTLDVYGVTDVTIR